MTLKFVVLWLELWLWGICDLSSSTCSSAAPIGWNGIQA